MPAANIIMQRRSALLLSKSTFASTCKRSVSTTSRLSVLRQGPSARTPSAIFPSPHRQVSALTRAAPISIYYRTNTTSASSLSSSEPIQTDSSKTPRRKPTLGNEAPDNTTITNPKKAENGTILSVKISQRASQKLNSINEQDNNPDQILRIVVESGGCHGYQYVLGLKPSSTIDPQEDSVFERDGAKFAIDQTSLEILRDSTIDYTTELIGSQFKVVDSPYATSSCGCGSSFSFDPSNIPQ